MCSGNIIGSAQITTTTTATGAIPSGATCVAASGNGVFPTPYTGVTSCTLPFGSRVNVLSFSHYTVQPLDFTLPNHQLRDDAALTWDDLCNDPAGTGNQNCDPKPPDCRGVLAVADPAARLLDGDRYPQRGPCGRDCGRGWDDGA